MTSDAFFAQGSGHYIPRPLSRGYWKHDSLHGRVIVGLIGYEIERIYGSDGFVPARLTVDMFRLAEFADVHVETRLLRDSRRLRLVEADLIVNGQPAARASCQLLRPTAPPAGSVWSPGPWSAPNPDDLPPPPDDRRGWLFDLRDVVGRLGDLTPKQAWTREKHLLIEGVELTPYTRIAVAADFASPYAHAGDAGIRYINSDVTVHLDRLPVSDWIGFEATGHESAQGVAVGHCRLHDLAGPLGYVTTCALANERRR